MAGPHVNVGHWVRKNAQIYPRKTALKWAERAFSYAELAGRMNRIAHALRALGIGKGDRVAVLLMNGPELVEIMFACSAIGALTVPLNWRLGHDELAFILRDCQPKVLVFHQALASRAEKLGALLPSMHRLAVADDGGDSPYEQLVASGDGRDAVDPAVGGDDAHLIMYTAGTTGHPKGVVLTHANCFWQSVNGWALGVSPETVALVLLPLFHVGGLNGSVTPMIHVGATVLLPPKFDVAETLATIERERATGMVAVPAVYQMMVDHPAFATTDLSSVQAFISGGAPLSHELIQRYHERRLEFRQGYGLTETSPGVTGMGPGECLRKAGTAGRACLYVDVEIVDSADRPLPPNTPGEVRVRGGNVMQGYWNRPDETAKVLRGGWFYSGDVGYLDDDGYLVLVDRKKDMIISGGENVYPAEVEKVLETHPALAEVAVVGRADAKWGEVPVAFVAAKPGASVDPDEVMAFCAARIARYKTPKAVFVVEALPRNAAGKVTKPALRALAAKSDG